MTAARPSLLEHLPAVRARLLAGGPALLALDFDGTLTEIVDDPQAPRLEPRRQAILGRIPAPPARWLAIVSGRALADVRERVGVEGAIYVGNHGLELEGPGLTDPDPAAGDVATRLASLLSSLPVGGRAVVENKTLTATLHVRPRDDAARHAALGAAIRLAVETAGFRLRPGKASWEIRPAAARTKGDVLRRLLELLPGAAAPRTLYAGDDTTDEDAFRALGEGVTARVGDPADPSAAHYHLPDPESLYAFLEQLLAGLPPEGPAA